MPFVPPSELEKLEETITSGSTVTVSSEPEANYRLGYYLINVRNEVQNKSKSLMLMVNRSDGVLRSTIFGKLGVIDTEVSESLSAGNVLIQIKNNEAYTLTVSIGQIILGG